MNALGEPTVGCVCVQFASMLLTSSTSQADSGSVSKASPERSRQTQEQRRRRFIATISAPDERRFRELTRRGLDIVSARSDASGHHVDALITLADIDALAEAGYALLVAGITDRRDPSTHKPEFIGFEEWHKEMLGDLERQHKEL